MGVESWIFRDRTNNLWKFFINKYGELVYSIMYGDGKWTKETKIDFDVIEYSIEIDEDEIIHIIYSNRDGILKYCKWDKGQWLGKNLYNFKKEGYDISELSLIIVKNMMHIFFILHNSDEKDMAQIVHYSWNENKNIETNIVSSINTSPNIFKYYQVEVVDGDRFFLIFAGVEHNGVSLRFCEYSEHKWSTPKRLYSINGNNVEFYYLCNGKKIQILNISREKSKYLLEYALINDNEKINIKKVCESIKEVKNPTLCISNDLLCAQWQCDDDILCSILEEEWSSPKKLNINVDKDVSVYNYSTGLSTEASGKFKRVFATQIPNLKLYLPESIFNSDFIEDYSEANTVYSKDSTENIVQTLKDNLNTLERVNRKLKSRIEELKGELEEKRKNIGQMEEGYRKLVSQNKKLEERCDKLLESQMSSYNEVENIKLQLKREIDRVIELEYKLSKYNLRNREIERSLEETSREKELLQEELNKERNKSFVYKIFRKD
ncbi:MAG: hypothetical protein Q8936_05425 [Bacillota bacterium]|nr:hypothetical protein [Bacillota bacterium]